MSDEDIVPLATSLEPAPEGEPPRPLVKLPGSKRWLVPAVQVQVSEYLTQSGGKFYEPFAGSAAVALAVGALGRELVVSDLSRELIGILAAARDKPDALHRMLMEFVNSGIDRKRYLEVRSRRPTNSLELAAWTLYLARLSFNGLWRVNSKGEFNVPYGQALTRPFPSLPAILAVCLALERAETLCADFRDVLPRIGDGDVAYLDPPYVGTFTQYATDGFELGDAMELASLSESAVKRGAAVIVSSPAYPKISDSYKTWAYRVTLQRTHRVAARAKDRKVFDEAIYTNRPELVDLTELQHNQKAKDTDKDEQAR